MILSLGVVRRIKNPKTEILERKNIEIFNEKIYYLLLGM